MKHWVGVDLHKRQMTICILGESEQMQEINLKLPTKDEGYKELIELLDCLCNGKKDDIAIGVESKGNTRYFKHKMETSGFKVHIVDTMKFKVISESVNKTDKRDAKTIAQFLSKDEIFEVKLCSETSEKLRMLLKSRSSLKDTVIKLKNQIHGIMNGIGIDTKNGQLNSEKGRKKIIELICDPIIKEIVTQIIISIELIEGQINKLEEKLKSMTNNDFFII